jgi:hypothetical protein
MPHLAGTDEEGMIARATIAEAGSLTPRYNYLQKYVQG